MALFYIILHFPTDVCILTVRLFDKFVPLLLFHVCEVLPPIGGWDEVSANFLFLALISFIVSSIDRLSVLFSLGTIIIIISLVY